MSSEKERILATLRKRPTFQAALATISEDGSPWVRYVTGQVADDLTIRVATSAQSKKVRHIRSQPRVHLVCGEIPPQGEGPFFQIEGEAIISTDVEEKRSIWFDRLTFFSGAPDDPNWCVLRVRPDRIRIHSLTSMETDVWVRDR